MARRGRPSGSLVRLLDDPGRFEVAAWHAFTELGFGPYPAAYLATFFIASDKPITTEIIDGVLLKSSTELPMASVRGHANRLRHKAPEAVRRASEHELKWLTTSAGLLVALVQNIAASNASGIRITLELLRQAGWGETLDRVGRRLEATLRSNFPPADGELSRSAARLLRRLRPTP